MLASTKSISTKSALSVNHTISFLNSDYVTGHHTQGHEMVPRTLSTGLADRDYAQFTQTTNRKYNYLDPNFFPAS